MRRQKKSAIHSGGSPMTGTAASCLSLQDPDDDRCAEETTTRYRDFILHTDAPRACNKPATGRHGRPFTPRFRHRDTSTADSCYGSRMRVFRIPHGIPHILDWRRHAPETAASPAARAGRGSPRAARGLRVRADRSRAAPARGPRDRGPGLKRVAGWSRPSRGSGNDDERSERDRAAGLGEVGGEDLEAAARGGQRHRRRERCLEG